MSLILIDDKGEHFDLTGFSIFWDVYIALVYGVLYLCFVAYPIVFSDIRGWSAGISGLAFCGIGVSDLSHALDTQTPTDTLLTRSVP